MTWALLGDSCHWTCSNTGRMTNLAVMVLEHIQNKVGIQLDNGNFSNCNEKAGESVTEENLLKLDRRHSLGYQIAKMRKSKSVIPSF